jgi:hypothetical protein
MPESRKPPVRRSPRGPRQLSDDELRDARPARGADPTGTIPNDIETDDVDRLLNELAGDVATVILHRRNGPAWEYLDHMEPGEFTLEAVKFAWGGGHYRARILDADRELVRSATFMIAGKPKLPPEDAPAIPNAPANDALQRMERMMERFIDMQSRGQPQRTDPLLATVLTALVQNMGKEPRRDPLLDTLVAGMMNREGMDVAKLLSMMESARENGLELGKLMSGGGPSGDDVGSLVRDVGKPLIELAKTVAERRQESAGTNGAPRPAVQAALKAANPPAQSPTPPAVDVNVPAHVAAWLPQLRRFLPYVLQWAKAGRDPGIKAAFVIDELDDTQADLLADIALTDTFVSDVLTYVPELLGATPDVREWVTQFLESVRELLTEPEPETVVPGIPERERIKLEKDVLADAPILKVAGKSE